MAQNIVGTNNFTDASGTRNDIEDYSAIFRGMFNNEGIINGIAIKATASPSTAIDVELGFFAIDNNDESFLVFRSKDEITNLVVPNTGAIKNYLIVAKVDLTNATIVISVVEGTSGTDPELVEGGSPEVYYIVLGQIVNSTGATNITNAMIVQDGVTLTNNSTPEVIGRVASGDGWSRFDSTLTYASATSITIKGDKSAFLGIGDKFKFVQSAAGKQVTITNISVAVNVTTLTVEGDAVLNAAITEPFLSKEINPQGISQDNIITAGSSKIVRLKEARQDNASIFYRDGAGRETGWGYKLSTGAYANTVTVTFERTYKEIPVVTSTYVGHALAASGAPANLGDLPDADDNTVAQPRSITTTGFDIRLVRMSKDGSDPGAFTNGDYYGFTFNVVGQS